VALNRNNRQKARSAFFGNNSGLETSKYSTAENQQIIKTLCNWKPQLIPQIEEIDEENLIKIRRDQKLWNGFFKQDK
jgi:hypothetical protein